MFADDVPDLDQEMPELVDDSDEEEVDDPDWENGDDEIGQQRLQQQQNKIKRCRPKKRKKNPATDPGYLERRKAVEEGVRAALNYKSDTLINREKKAASLKRPRLGQVVRPSRGTTVPARSKCQVSSSAPVVIAQGLPKGLVPVSGPPKGPMKLVPVSFEDVKNAMNSKKRIRLVAPGTIAPPADHELSSTEPGASSVTTTVTFVKQEFC